MVIYSQYIYIIWLCTYIGNIQKTTSTIHDIYGNPNIDQKKEDQILETSIHLGPVVTGTCFIFPFSWEMFQPDME